MNDTLVPLSEVASLIVNIVNEHRKQAEALDADAKPPISVKAEKDETTDVNVEDKKLSNTNGPIAAGDLSKAVAPMLDKYTTDGDDTKAKDESSAVQTERGSVVATADKLASFICSILDKKAEEIIARAGSRGACGGVRRLDGSGQGVGNKNTQMQPKKKKQKEAKDAASV